MSKAFGEESPTLGEDPVSWQTWSDGAGGSPEVVGNADWGKLKLDYFPGEEGRSAVYDLGSAKVRKFTLTENRYGAGAEDAVLQYRTDTVAFLQDDVLPAWTNYSGQFSVNCRYVQARETTLTFKYVDATNGNDGWAGTFVAPWKTIAKVNGAALVPGDVVLFKCGETFTGQLTPAISGTAGAYITYGAYGTGAKPKITGDPIIHYRCLFVGAQNYLVFEGLDFDGLSLITYDVIKLELGSSYITINNCDIHHGNGPYPPTSNGILITRDSSYITVSNCNIHHNGIDLHGHGIYCSAPNNIITNNTVYANSSMGIQIYDGTNPLQCNNNIISYNNSHSNGRYGIVIEGTNNSTHYNILRDNSNGIIYSGTGVDNLLYNNTIVGNAYLGIGANSSSTNLIYRNNIVYNNVLNIDTTGSIGTIESNNLVGVDPKFTDEVNHVYTLQGTSPAINAGTNVGLTLDYAGVAVNNPPEIGAYEYT